MQKHRRLALRIAATLPIDAMAVADVEQARFERFQRRIQASQRPRRQAWIFSIRGGADRHGLSSLFYEIRNDTARRQRIVRCAA
jgi:hypothetical protein